MAITPSAQASAATPAINLPVLRISTEHGPGHSQTRALQRFVERVRAQAPGRLDIRLHHSAELFRDADVLKALLQGKIEMALPGTWQLDRLVPDTGIFLLPAFYGQSADANHRLRDGAVGQAVNLGLKRQLDVKVLGRWLDLGYANIYTVRKIERHADLSGLHIGIAGGEANMRRLRAMGATAIAIPWPDLLMARKRGELDGLLTTHETVISNQLWKAGILHCFEDHQYFAQSIPLISGRYWNRIPADLRSILSQAWEETVDAARAEAVADQDTARAILQQHGIRIFTPSPTALAAQRRHMMKQQWEWSTLLEIDPLLIAQINAKLRPEADAPNSETPDGDP